MPERFDMERMLNSRSYEFVRIRGKERVMSSLGDGQWPESPLLTEDECVQEILAFAVARMICSVIGDRFLVNRFAVREGKRAGALIGRDRALMLKLADEFGIDAAETDTDGLYAVHFTSFLKYSSKMRSPEWKLLYQRIRKGYVYVDEHKLVRLIEQAVTDHLSEKLPPYTDTIRKALDAEIAEVVTAVGRLKEEFQKNSLGEIDEKRYPPCMKAILNQIRTSQNVPQMGRFAIVTFLHAIGMTSEQIFDIFSAVPDFRADVTRYQIEHITGKISATEYSVPECSTMKSYGICFNPDSLCNKEWMKHPMTYYIAKGRDLRSPSRKKEPSTPQ
ncbi:MAG: DNA primase large subunit PriL [Thermoplasmata archaeon YP2-bin.285]|uniref:DNA primase large subunit PriL n=1 Tax=Candidatus Sysuiplasma superficiale TaxID=2823368 RepID=A0A8J7YL51_9ARCH|nr:DNA primase large subunit PriL [Candidatus Sysuiplasma superficiale]